MSDPTTVTIPVRVLKSILEGLDRARQEVPHDPVEAQSKIDLVQMNLRSYLPVEPAAPVTGTVSIL